VTVDLLDALQTLGLEPDEREPKRIRRAYLRQVKRHPPERDPEGFQRIRAAYDALSDPWAFAWFDGEDAEPVESAPSPAAAPRADTSCGSGSPTDWDDGLDEPLPEARLDSDRPPDQDVPDGETPPIEALVRSMETDLPRAAVAAHQVVAEARERGGPLHARLLLALVLELDRAGDEAAAAALHRALSEALTALDAHREVSGLAAMQLLWLEELYALPSPIPPAIRGPMVDGIARCDDASVTTLKAYMGCNPTAAARALERTIFDAPALYRNWVRPHAPRPKPSADWAWPMLRIIAVIGVIGALSAHRRCSGSPGSDHARIAAEHLLRSERARGETPRVVPRPAAAEDCPAARAAFAAIEPILGSASAHLAVEGARAAIDASCARASDEAPVPPARAPPAPRSP